MTAVEEPPPPANGGEVDPGQLQQLLRELPGWQLAADGRRIVRSLAFPSGISSLLFTFIILELATETGGVPAVDVRNETLRVILGGYEDGVSCADLALARRINLGD